MKTNRLCFTIGGDKFGGGKRASGPAAATKPPAAAKVSSVPPPAPAIKAAPAKPIAASSAAVKPLAPPVVQQENAAPAVNKSADIVDKKADPALLNELAVLKNSVDQSSRAYAELRLEMEGLEKERDFYFEKLRDIEVLLQEVEDKNQGNDLTAAIFKILYATIDGFEPVDAAGAAQQDGDVPATF